MFNSNKSFAIAIASLSVVAVCAIGVAVGAGLGAFDNLEIPWFASKPVAAQVTAATSTNTSTDASSSSSTSPNEKQGTLSNDAADAAKEASAASADAKSTSNVIEPPSATSSSKSVNPTKNAAIINLSNPNDYYDVNVFLSNFAEWPEFYRNDQSFDRDDYDLRQLVNWAMWHNAINNEGTLVNKAVDVPGAPASESSRLITSAKATSYPRHMRTELIEDSIERYIGIDVDLSNYDSGDGAYYERDGVMYEGLYRGDAAPRDNVVLADSAKSLGGDVVRIDFTIYSGNSSYEVVSDTSWYGLDGKKLTAAMRSAGSSKVTTQTGTAYIEIVGTGSNRTFHLVSFKVGGDVKTAL